MRTLPDSQTASKNGDRYDWDRFDKAALLMIAIVFILKLHALFVFEINWDEFFMLGLVHDNLRGDVSAFFFPNVFTVGFGWLSAVSANEVDQIIAGRFVMWLFNLATAWFLYQTSRSFSSRTASLVAVLSYLSFSFVFRHASSFRTDPIATALLMGSIWLTVSGRFGLRGALLSGALIGLVGLVTIKSVLYAPILAVILFARYLMAAEKRTELLRFLATAVATVTTYSILYEIRAASAPQGFAAVQFLSSASNKLIDAQTLFPQRFWIQQSILENPLFWIVLLSGIGVSAMRIATNSGLARLRWLMLLSFASLMGTLLFYVASYPYYYTFMLAPAAVLSGAFVDEIPASRKLPIIVIVSGIFSLNVFANYLRVLDQSNSGQREILATIHQIFPEPVSYIDRCSMVSRYHKLGLFMASWQMSEYWETGRPIMRAALQQGQPRFLLDNSPYLNIANFSEGDDIDSSASSLLEEDRATLKDNFVPYWGILYVAGKSIDISRTAPTTSFEILIEGPYTLEGAGPVAIDGTVISPGHNLLLHGGMHSMALIHDEGRFVLRWGKDLYRPVIPPPKGPVFSGF